MGQYTRQEILARIQEFVQKSNFISDYVLLYAQELEDQEQLQKLLVVVYDAFITEKSLSTDDKKEISDIIIDMSQKKIELYKKTEKQIRSDIEALDKEDFEENLLNF